MKAGGHVSGAAMTDDYNNVFIREAESYINTITRYNFSDTYTTLNADVKYLLEEAASNLAAIYAIQWDMRGYTSRIEAEDMINILWARFKQCIKVLEDQKTTTFIKGA